MASKHFLYILGEEEKKGGAQKRNRRTKPSLLAFLNLTSSLQESPAPPTMSEKVRGRPRYVQKNSGSRLDVRSTESDRISSFFVLSFLFLRFVRPPSILLPFKNAQRPDTHTPSLSCFSGCGASTASRREARLSASTPFRASHLAFAARSRAWSVRDLLPGVRSICPLLLPSRSTSTLHSGT